MFNITIKALSCFQSGQNFVSVAADTGKTESVPLEKCFKRKFKNFGRLDNMSKAIAYAVAPLLTQYGFYQEEFKKNSIHLFFSSEEGCVNSDREYFSDFIQYGETAGRANKFLYTLPTSPLGEASVHFGLTGRMLFFTAPDNGFKNLFRLVSNTLTISSDKTEYALGGTGRFTGTNPEVIFFLLQQKISGQSCLDKILTENLSFSDLKLKITDNLLI
jgi:hypothetical protein